MSKKTIQAYEYERGLIILDLGKHKITDQVTDEEFSELATLSNIRGVNHDDRRTFLESNGHEVNRENMLDASLKVKPEDSEQSESLEVSVISPNKQED